MKQRRFPLPSEHPWPVEHVFGSQRWVVVVTGGATFVLTTEGELRYEAKRPWRRWMGGEHEQRHPLAAVGGPREGFLVFGGADMVCPAFWLPHLSAVTGANPHLKGPEPAWATDLRFAHDGMLLVATRHGDAQSWDLEHLHDDPSFVVGPASVVVRTAELLLVGRPKTLQVHDPERYTKVRTLRTGPYLDVNAYGHVALVLHDDRIDRYDLADAKPRKLEALPLRGAPQGKMLVSPKGDLVVRTTEGVFRAAACAGELERVHDPCAAAGLVGEELLVGLADEVRWRA